VKPWPASGKRIDGFDALAAEFRGFTRKNIRTLWVLRRALPWNWLDSTVAVESLERRYRKDIVQLALAELPDESDRPRFIFSATDMSFGVNWVSEQRRVGSYLPGYVSPVPGWPAARAVAASSCFPPAFEPLPIKLAPEQLKRGREPRGPRRDELVRGLTLTDGGVYDNMGLEPVWKDHAIILVSDGGATFDRRAERRVLGRIGRYAAIQGKQSAAIRKRWLIASFKREVMDGVYLGIGSVTDHFERGAAGYPESLVDDFVSEIRTDLDYFSEAEAGALQNHGYTLADVALRVHGTAWCEPDAPDARLPCPEWADEDKVQAALADSAKRRLLGRWRWWEGLRGRT
jgi:NTE family protein